MPQKLKGFNGKYLRVDLSEGKTLDWNWDEQCLRAYLGGTGVGAKVLYDEVPPRL